MQSWKNRPSEVAYLLNPAFCGRILYNTIKTYNDITNKAISFPLVYLILPLILHKKTRDLINSRTQFLIWLQRNPEILINFSKRTKELVPITSEAIELLLQTGLIEIGENGNLQIVQTMKPLSKTKYINEEIKECIKKSEHVAKWFANAGKTETIYIGLGVRP